MQYDRDAAATFAAFFYVMFLNMKNGRTGSCDFSDSAVCAVLCFLSEISRKFPLIHVSFYILYAAIYDRNIEKFVLKLYNRVTFTCVA